MRVLKCVVAHCVNRMLRSHSVFAYWNGTISAREVIQRYSKKIDYSALNIVLNVYKQM